MSSLLEGRIVFPEVLADWTGSSVAHAKRAHLLIARIKDSPELSGLLGSKEVLDVKKKLSELETEMETLNKEAADAVDSFDADAALYVWQRAQGLGLVPAVKSRPIEHDLRTAIDQYQVGPDEYMKQQRRQAKDAIVNLLTRRERLIRQLEEFEKVAQSSEYVHFCSYVPWRVSDWY